MMNLLSLGLFEPFSVKTLPLTVETFLFGLMIVAGVLYGYYVYKLHADSFSACLKPLVLIMGGGLLLRFATISVSANALLLSFYLFSGAVASFAMH